MYRYLPLLLLLLSGACGSVKPNGPFDAAKAPAKPDYSKMDNWAAHPDKSDPADQTPSPELKNEQATAPVDVFFLYPTTLTGTKPNENTWNGAVEDAALNTKTDASTIQYQASIFNGSGRIFAPRYRQAHLNTFFCKDKKSAGQALDLAYEDIRSAFDYYMKHWNKGRPFILAGHSQGGRHTMTLIHDLIENTSLEKQLVAAYIVGWPVQSNYFKHLQPCKSPAETGCFCTWRTWKRSYGMRRFNRPIDVVCTNPLTWTTTEQYAPAEANHGAVIRPFNKIYPHCTDAQVHNGVLLCRKPKFKGSILFTRRNYHVGDMNIFYMNVRENAQQRVKSYLKR
jgi:pimeloyl-ACP methyl ester carboxylesterase